MPAINSLSSATLPAIALPNGNANSFPLPINNVVNRPDVLLKDNGDDNSYAHEMAYSGHLQTAARVKRGDSNSIPYGTYSEHTCYKSAIKLENLTNTFYKIADPRTVQADIREYTRVVSSPDCILVLPTSTTQDPLDSPWLKLKQDFG